MGNHRAERRGPRRHPSETLSEPVAPYVGRRVAGREPVVPALAVAAETLPAAPAVPPYPATYARDDAATVFHDLEITESLPLVRCEPGKRRAARRAPQRSSLIKGLPSAPVLVGLAALAVSAGGALTVTDPAVVDVRATTSSITQATALSGSSGSARVTAAAGPAATSDVVEDAAGGAEPTTDSAAAQELAASRRTTVSRDSQRDALADAADSELVAEAEAQAEQRNSKLAQFAQQAEQRASTIKQNLWQLPIASGAYRVTARYGQYGLWASYHTGLDFAAPTGTPIRSIANGVVTSAGYDGSYGNKTVVTLDDGTELWYCHQNTFAAGVGDAIRAGETIGYVGSTGNVTGPHVHVEVRPGGGDPVDPYAAMLVHGLTP